MLSRWPYLRLFHFLIMRNLLNGSGPINALLLNWGLIDSSIPFLTDPNWAKINHYCCQYVDWYSCYDVNLYRDYPKISLKIKSKSLELTAPINGKFLKSITFPQILFVMTPALIQQFIGNINNFNVIYLLTGGGPANSNFYGAGSTDLFSYPGYTN